MSDERKFIASGSQTIGPYYGFALTIKPELGNMAHEGAQGEQIRLALRVLDEEGVGVADSMVELWQADANGKYRHPSDTQDGTPDPAFEGFGRLGSNAEGEFLFHTVKPGRVPGPDGKLQAPHINVTVFARGILLHLNTRIYFAGDPANEEDAILSMVPEDRQGTLLAHQDRKEPGVWRLDIHLCGDKETVFFEM
jgi:protocatechuate 3,4-dioxygenase, alpha subunit